MILAVLALAGAAFARVAVWGPSYGPTPGPVVALAVHRTNPLTVYAGTRTVWEDGTIKSRGALYRSTTGGRRWIKTVDEGVYAVLVDPRHPATVYLGTEYDGVLKSVDGGRTWRAARSGLPNLATVTTLAIDPVLPQVVYAGLDGYDGLFKTTNGGRRWRASGLADYTVDELVIDPRTPTILYAAIWDPQFANDPENRLARSMDGGRSWSVPEYGLRSIGSFAITPLSPAIVYAGTSRGVFKSTDGGRLWRAVGLAKMGAVTALTIDPKRPSIVYAGTNRRGVFRSTNGGRSWSAFNRGLTSLEVHVLALDSTGRVLYAGTDAGVFDYRLSG